MIPKDGPGRRSVEAVNAASIRVNAVALLLMIAGSAAWTRFAWHWWDAASFSPGVELLLLPAGIGLLRRREFWRRISARLVLFGMVLVVALPYLGYVASPVLDVRIHGPVLDATSPRILIPVVAYTAALLVSLLWIYRLLQRADIRVLFDDTSRRPRPGRRPFRCDGRCHTELGRQVPNKKRSCCSSEQQDL